MSAGSSGPQSQPNTAELGSLIAAPGRKEQVKKTRSLAFVVSVLTAAAIAASMGVYALFQYLTLPDITLKELVFTHLWHVIALGMVIYLFCLLLLRRVLLQPLNEIYLHLYGARGGQLKPLDVKTRVTELQSIVNGINLMMRVQRGEDALEDSALEQAQQDLQEIKDLILRLPDSSFLLVPELADRIADLERRLRTMALLHQETSQDDSGEQGSR